MEAKRASLLYVAIVASTFLISVVLVYLAFQSYVNGRLEEANYYAMWGISSAAISILMLYQVRKRPKLMIKPYHVMTAISCEHCGFKTVRDFQKGDYVFQHVGKCPKCDGELVITSIYRSEEEEELT